MKPFISLARPARSVRRRRARCLIAERLEDRTLLSTFSVSNTDDHGPGSLRQAITSANGQANGASPDEIHFAIGGSGVHTIKPASPLPAITDPVLLLGTTQTGYAGAPLIELNGSAAGAGVDGLTITAGGFTVSAMVINRFSGEGIVLATKGGDTVTGCYIGTDSAGKLDEGNTGVGLRISGASGNLIGGHNDRNLPLNGVGNLISGNDSGGVVIARAENFPRGELATSNVLLGNYIGIDVTGTFPIGNLGDGVSISTGRNQIGDASYAGDNVISGNTGDGLVLQGAFATQNAVQGNAIGPSGPDYNVQIGNTGDAVSLAAGSSGTTIANAVISASGRHGIEISGAGTRNNILQSNFINFNHRNGVEISGTGATNNILQVNNVGYNQENGIHILGAETSGNLVLGCTIQQNALDGVRIENSPGNSIGGTGAGNGISGNGSGVEITGAAATGNLVLGNDIFDNVDGVKIEGAPGNSIGGAVNQAGNHISANTGDGILIHASTGTLVQGNFVGISSSGSFAASNNQGVVLISSASNTIGGTVAGAGNIISGNTGSGIWFQASADLGGSSANLVQGNRVGTNAAGTAAVGNGDDGIKLDGASDNTIGGTVQGAGNLISGNADNGIDLTAATGDTTGNLIQGNRIGTDVGGTAALGNGLGVDIYFTSGNAVGGPAPGAGNVISGNMGNGIVIQGATASANLVQGNLIGTDAAGSAGLGNGINGIVLLAPGNTIGGTTAGSRNVVSANALGILIDTADALGNVVQGNYLGTDAAGAAAMGNDGAGCRIDGGGSNSIGGTSTGAGNVISSNVAQGIDIAGGTGSVVEGNLVGMSANGLAPLGNGGAGIAIGIASQTKIGGTAAGAANMIAFNGGAGVAVTGGVADFISADRIHDNGGLGIDLGDDGVTPNDPGDADAGSNLLQNFPANVSVATAGRETVVRGTLDGVASSSFTVEWFASVAADPSGFGEGAMCLATTTAATDASGHADLFTILPVALPLGRLITATATDQMGNTSEFSRAALVQGPAIVQWSVSSLVVDENAGTASLLVTRTENSDVPVTVHVATAGGDALAGINYKPIDTVLTFASGVMSEPLTIAIRDDGVVAPDRQVVITIDRPSQSSLLGTPVSTTLVIHNTDQPPLVRMVELRLVSDRKKNITQVIVSLSGGVNPSQAKQLATFRLATAGKRGSFDAKNAQILKLRSVRYDAATATITLTLFRSFRLAKTVQFRINGSAPAGLIDATGRLIDGNHDGRPGGNAIALLRRRGVTVA